MYLVYNRRIFIFLEEFEGRNRHNADPGSHEDALEKCKMTLVLSLANAKSNSIDFFFVKKHI